MADTECGLMWPQADHMHQLENGRCIPAIDCDGVGEWDPNNGDYGGWVCPKCHYWLGGRSVKTDPKCTTRFYLPEMRR